MIASFFGLLFGTIWTTLKLAAVGGVIGAASLAGGKLVGGLQGFVVAAALGAVLVVGVYGSGYLGAASDARNAALIAQLEAEKASLALQLEAAKVSAKDLADAVAEQKKVAEHNAGLMGELHDEIEMRDDSPNCWLTPKERDLINQIQ